MTLGIIEEVLQRTISFLKKCQSMFCLPLVFFDDKSPVRELKRLGWGMREDGGGIGLAYFRVHLLITSPADFDNLNGTMRLDGSSDADTFAFPMSAASSEFRPNPTPIGTSGKVRQYQLAPLPNSGDRLWVPNAFFSGSGFIRPTRT